MKMTEQRYKSSRSLSVGSSAGRGVSSMKSASIGKAKQRKKPKGKSTTQLDGQLLPVQSQQLSSPFQSIPSSLQKASPGFPTIVPKRSSEKSNKFKLQLYPIDGVTREALEKDKHNPYLELTLGTRKKISSVVKHMSTKWGNSKAAAGELMLFPYSAGLESLACHSRWTCRDIDTTAADVYAAVGNPAIFRLRYGWFSNLESKVYPAPLIPVYSEENQHDKTQTMNIAVEEKQQLDGCNRDYQPMTTEDSLKQGPGLPILSNSSVRSTDKDILKKSNGAFLSLIDCLSNISCGALLSEMSQNTDIAHGQQSSVLQNTSLQQIPNYDSFDAAIASLFARNQATSTQIPHSSIWEAEETCHAFPFQKTASSGKEVPPSSEAHLASCRPNNDLDFTRLKTAEPLSQAMRAEDDARQESATDCKLQSSTDKLGTGMCWQTESDNASNCVGMMDSYRPESIGPLDVVSPSSRQIICGDSVGLSGLITSLDTSQNCSIF